MREYITLLKNTTMFEGIHESDIPSLLGCLNTKVITYKKGEYIVRAGEPVKSIGIVISGLLLIQKEDYWGNCSIIQEISPGLVFAESYAFLEDFQSEVNIVANTETKIISFDVHKINTVCANSCSYHKRLIQNLIESISRKNVALTKKIDYLSKKTIRERLLAYLSEESIKNQSCYFKIPFNRQQLAEYLSVDRSALSNEIGKLQKEGIITSNRSYFSLNNCSLKTKK